MKSTLIAHSQMPILSTPKSRFSSLPQEVTAKTVSHWLYDDQFVLMLRDVKYIVCQCAGDGKILKSNAHP